MTSAAVPGRSGFYQLMVPFWVSSEGWKALLQLVATLAVIFGGIYLQLWGNRLLGDVTDALVGRKWELL